MSAEIQAEAGTSSQAHAEDVKEQATADKVSLKELFATENYFLYSIHYSKTL